MYYKKYNKFRKTIVKNKGLFGIIKLLYKILPVILFLCYPALIAYLAYMVDIRLVRVIVVPAGVFIAVTVIRIIVNRPRPYEDNKLIPLFQKSTKGKSFPSRHVASAFIISYAFLYINPWLGIPSLVISTVITILRPVAGVHYITDVLAAFAISSVFGILFFFII